MNARPALYLAGQGYPIFPCVPGGKKPLTPRGFYDASADPAQVAEWWEKWPDANIAFPTGSTRVIVLDVDPETGGEDSLAGLECDARPLPQTFSIQTGGGGKHLYFQRPESGLRNSVERLGPGLDIRGDGGDVLLPTSRTVGPYKSLNSNPIAPFPSFLLELLIEPKPRMKGSAGVVDLDPIGPPIYRGTRNTTLASIAGRLRARGHHQDTIERHLHEVNTARCRPMLLPTEVSKIAESISRYPAGRARPVVTREVNRVIDRVEAAVLYERWSGLGGDTDRAVLVALIKLSQSYGVLIPAGVRISVSHRNLALLSGVRRATVPVSVKRLRRSGWLTIDNHGRRRREAGAFVLKVPQERTTQPYVSNGWLNGTELRDALPPLRHGAGRLSKKAGQVLEALLWESGAASIEALVSATKIRRDNLRQRYLRRLEETGIVALEGEVVRLADNWRKKLEIARELGGEIDAERADKRRYEIEREMFAQKLREEGNGNEAN